MNDSALLSHATAFPTVHNLVQTCIFLHGLMPTLEIVEALWFFPGGILKMAA